MGQQVCILGAGVVLLAVGFFWIGLFIFILREDIRHRVPIATKFATAAMVAIGVLPILAGIAIASDVLSLILTGDAWQR